MRFADYGKRVVFAAFDGGEITSDAGVLLLRERARRIRLFERMAGCFTDHRDRERLTHTLPALLAQRVCGMALGYEDIIDHDTLRFDPALKLLAAPGTEYPGTPAPLAGKSTLSRLEQSWETGNRRYHQMVPNLKSLSNLFVALFLDACDTPPARITLDIDATDVETHGRQENAFFHGYYEHRCFLPLYVFCGRHLLLAQLRPANIDGARGARNQIRRIVAMIRERWPNVAIVLRGDSGFARENLMRWCEGNAVDYVFGLARNDVLLKKAQRVRGKAAMAMIETGHRMQTRVQSRVRSVDQCHRPIWECTHQLHDAIVRAIADAMPGVNHGKVLWRRLRATRPRPIEHDRPYPLTVARKQGDLGDDSSCGSGTVAPPAVWP